MNQSQNREVVLPAPFTFIRIFAIGSVKIIIFPFFLKTRTLGMEVACKNVFPQPEMLWGHSCFR